MNIDFLKTAIGMKNFEEAYHILQNIHHPHLTFSELSQLLRLSKKIPSQLKNLESIKIALLSDFTVDQFSELLKFWLERRGFKAEIFVPPFGTWKQMVLDPSSDYYLAAPDMTLIQSDPLKSLMGNAFEAIGNGSFGEEVLSRAINELSVLKETINQNSRSYLIQMNAVVPLERPFGIYDTMVRGSLSNLYRDFNKRLSEQIAPGYFVFDLDDLSNRFGKRRWFDERFWYHSKHAFSFDAVVSATYAVAATVSAIKGKAKKCIVLDLDNTLWGGVIGDDGLGGIKLGSGPEGEAYVDFQKYLRRLKDRGIVLAVCSKNEDAAARLPFLEHPNMILKENDISVFKANWDNKAANIQAIADELNLGLDSFVFVDDNPAERNLVRKHLHMVSVPELPSDPALYIRCLEDGAFFETVSFSEEDKNRAEHYRQNAMRATSSRAFVDVKDYLKSLKMTSEVGSLDDFHLPRMSQLINKSNQFHLTTTRYSENEIKDFALSSKYDIFYFKLADIYGDNGLISVVILEKNQSSRSATIDTWVMSCRVLSRTMEEFIMNYIVDHLKKLEFNELIGVFKPTVKNKLVEGLYARLGFDKRIEDEAATEGAKYWHLNVGCAKVLETYIEEI